MGVDKHIKWFLILHWTFAEQIFGEKKMKKDESMRNNRLYISATVK